MRAKAEIEARKGDQESIVISEIPYQVNKARLIEKIAELAREERVRGIKDVRDESDRHGMRIVVDVKKGEPAQVILNNLYKHTPLQDSFGVIFLAIVDQRPRVLNLLDACELFIDFRREVVRRRTAFELRKAEARAHVLEGYVIALDHLDEVIALIRAARTPEIAQDGPDRALQALGNPGRRDPQAAALAAHGSRAPEDPGRAQGARDPDRRPQGHPGHARAHRRDHRRPSSRRSPRPTASRVGPRSWPRPTRSRSRT